MLTACFACVRAASPRADTLTTPALSDLPGEDTGNWFVGSRRSTSLQGRRTDSELLPKRLAAGWRVVRVLPQQAVLNLGVGGARTLVLRGFGRGGTPNGGNASQVRASRGCS